VGVQTGSSSKLFTLLTALEQGVPFGFPQTVPAATTLTGFTNCKGEPTGPWHVINDSPSEKGGFSLYNATAQSVNIYFGKLELKVGLCNVVKMAATLGVTRADGRSLLKWDHGQPPADDLPSFTLGSVNVSPMSMAAAYATVAARGMYCTPIAVARIISGTGARLPVQKPDCHQAIPTGVADAASYVLQSVLTVGTAGGQGIGRPAAGKTGTSDNFDFAAFGGYTRPGLLRVRVQPHRPDQVPDVRHRLLLPAKLPRRNVRRGRARPHLAHDVREREPGQSGPGLRHE
jgi:membrane peptidoglycan carboxypeptidase